MFDWLFDLIGFVLDVFDSNDETPAAPVNRRSTITPSTHSRYLQNRPSNLTPLSNRPYKIGTFVPQPPKKPLVPGPFSSSNPYWRNSPANPNNFNSPWNPNNPNSPRNIHNRHRPHGHR